MDIKRCLKIRLYPTLDQFQQFIKTGGCRRFVYNKYVESMEQFYKDNIKGKCLTKEQKKEIYKQFKYKTEKELKEEYSTEFSNPLIERRLINWLSGITKTDPQSVYLFHGDKPLFLFYNKRLQVLIYSSSDKYIRDSIFS